MTAPNAPSVRDRQVRTVAARRAIEGRQRLAEHAAVLLGEDDITRPAPWITREELHRRLPTSRSRAEFIAENGPDHLLAVLKAHGLLLDAVALHSVHCDCATCLAADQLLDLYSPEVLRDRT